jgi:hypothetical protein
MPFQIAPSAAIPFVGALRAGRRRASGKRAGGRFLSDYNEAESLVLRWEIIEPMKPGEGGVIRFRCRVR